MSKYIGTKAVNLSTTSADVTGNADIDGNLTVGGDLTVSGTTITVDHATAQTVDLGDNDKIRLGADYELQLWSDGTTGQISGDINHTGSITTDGLTVDTNTLYVDTTNNLVGIGTTSPSRQLSVYNASGDANITIRTGQSSSGNTQLMFGDAGADNAGRIQYNHSSNHMQFNTNGSEAMRIDLEGRVGIGVTPTNWYTTGNSILQVGTAATFWGSTNTSMASVVANAFYDQTNTRWEYMNNDYATWYEQVDGKHIWFNAPSGSSNNPITWSEVARIDVNGNFLVATDNNDTWYTNTNEGFNLNSGNFLAVARNGGTSFVANRLGANDGDAYEIRRNGSITGRVGNYGTNVYLAESSRGVAVSSGRIYGSTQTGAPADGAMDLGNHDARWKDLYLTGGIQFDNRSNKLDDYEEGTWTPSLLSDNTDATWGYNARVGRYVKVGSMVHIWGAINLSSRSGGGGGVFVTGLPFTMMGSGIPAANVGILVDNMDQDRRVVTAQLNESNSSFRLIDLSGGTETHGAMNVARFSGNENVRFMFAYPV